MSPTERSEIRYGSAERALDALLARDGAFDEAAIEALIASRPELEPEIREILGACGDVDRALASARATEDSRRAETERLIAELSAHPSASTRYAREGEIGRGGMGAVFRVRDRRLDRALAMKVVLDQARGDGSGATPAIDPRALSRFLAEARITSQLDHPGIVPVHELGLDEQGRVYFTMKLVGGRTLAEVYRRRAQGDPEWGTAKVLGLVQRVCEAVAFAHERGVIHRDLKPSNVMVGDFGEVYVMDWGLARRTDRERGVEPSVRESSADDALSTLVAETREGSQAGTPAYMSPEQAGGRIDEMGPRSDVYSIGAMLYELIAGHPPYCEPGSASTPAELLAHVLRRPPRRLESVDAPAELVAICEKAMARQMVARYRDVGELSRDLQSFLDGRVVRAYETGAWAEARKWVRRNRALAASLAAAAILLVAGLWASLVFRSRAAAKAVEAAEQARIAEANEGIATRRANDVLSLSAIQDLRDLEDRADALWPAGPELLPKYEAWLAEARDLVDGRSEDRARGVERRPGLADHTTKLAELRDRVMSGAPGETETDRRADRWWQAQLTKLVSDLRSFSDDERGLFSAGISEAHGWGIRKRAEFARTIRERSVDGPVAKRRWDEAIPAIAASTSYDGLKLSPQTDLLPIGVDPDSHLWEFAELATGDPAERGSDGRLVLKESTGLVLVLIPGGTFEMGAQRDDPSGANYDPQARENEGPVHEVRLSPYFLSKYEMTQGQWERFVGKNPSNYGPLHWSKRSNREGKGWTALHPVEQVTWLECAAAMARLGLALPSEAQWENAARGGTHGVFSTGPDLASLAGSANLADLYAKTHGMDGLSSWEKDLDDGNTVHAEVGSYRANAYGLHDVHGNLWEWCSDGFDTLYYRRSPAVDPVAPIEGVAGRVFRGGGFGEVAENVRCAVRGLDAPDYRSNDLGLRPARALER